MDKLLDNPTYVAWTTSLAILQNRLELVYDLMEQEATRRKLASEPTTTATRQVPPFDKSDVLNQVLQTVKEMTSKT